MAPSRWFAVSLLSLVACSQTASAPQGPAPIAASAAAPSAASDPRVGLAAGVHDAAEAASNLSVLSRTRPAPGFEGFTHADIAFTGRYAVQGTYGGFAIWDVAAPASPVLVSQYNCPASQNDVSVYQQRLLFMSAEAYNGRLDCGSQGIPPTDSVSAERIRGIRIFDISDIANPRYITSVQTCRGSHTHTLVEDARDPANVYIYVSGSAPVRSPREMPGCVSARPAQDPNSSLFRIEVIRVPVDDPMASAIVASARFLDELAPNPVRTAEAPEDRAARLAAVERERAAGGFVIMDPASGLERVANPFAVMISLDSIANARGAVQLPPPPDGTPVSGFEPRPTYEHSAADTAALRAALPGIVRAQFEVQRSLPSTGPNQCHDITVYPELGLAGGACGGYGLLLDIRDPLDPTRLHAVADSNFAYWHSATFNNDGTKILFSDEWGGGGSPKCRATDPKEWGADAIFTIDPATRQMEFQSYYKIPAPQTSLENCVAHNGSLIPIPDRDIMVQGWYQGGISVFDWTDPANPTEIAFFDRGPSDPNRQGSGGVWSVYWYNGYMFSSEIARGLDITDLVPSPYVSANEINAAKTVIYPYFNAQTQPRFVWPASFALACAYVDQLERGGGLGAARISAVRSTLFRAESASSEQRRGLLTTLASELNADAASAGDPAKVRKLADAVSQLANEQSAARCSPRVI
jgi:hypothetical protein